MRGTQPRLRHLVGAATLTGSLLFAALTFASLPAGAQTTTAAVATASCPVLSVGNPSAGNTIQQGDYVVSGEAWDPAASSGSGIARVDMFLGPRDEGGTFLASAVPGLGNNPRAYSVTVNIPTVNEGNTFAAYAISAVTGQETAVLVPIFIGTPTRSVGATPTPLPTTETVISTCPGGAAAATPAAAGMPMASTGASSGGASTASTPVPAAPAAGGSTTAATTGANSCPVLTLGNPNPGDVVAAGDLVISGGAYVAGANPAPGVSRVDLFLGPRDQGGTFLGSGTPGTGQAGPTSWSVTVTIPDWGRGSSFAAYAIGANGQESSIIFPIFVGTVPPRNGVGATPTPIPQNVTTASTCAH